MTADFKDLIAHVADGNALSEAEAEAAFNVMMSGEATPSQMGAFLMALRVRGETVEELTGAARVMRAKVLPIVAPPGAIDTCGTGGDAKGTYNVSTAVSFIIAACGVPAPSMATGRSPASPAGPMCWACWGSTSTPT